jgi:carbonic anhydrase/acetyltransferase-like protein (isoleucine patch superfamily)
VKPGAVLCGNVTVGVGATIDPGATVTRGREIGSGAVVAAGAVVLHGRACPSSGLWNSRSTQSAQTVARLSRERMPESSTRYDAIHCGFWMWSRPIVP